MPKARFIFLLTTLTAAATSSIALFGVAASASASSNCPNELYRIGPGATLPDCRAYEMVSPMNKNGGEVDGGDAFLGSPPAPEQAASSGEAVTYASQTAFTGANPTAGAVSNQYLSRRAPDGWVTQELTPAQDMPDGALDAGSGEQEEFSLFQGFSENLEHAFLLAYEPSPVAGAPAGYFNPYLRDEASGGYRLLSTATPPGIKPELAPNATEGFKISYEGMSLDGSHVVFSANDALTPEAPLGVESLYEWNEGRLELVSVLPASEGGAPVTDGLVRFGSFAATQYGLGELKEGSQGRAISSSGSRVFWSAREAGAEEKQSQALYMRELTAAGAQTVRLSASQGGGTVFQGASADGGRAFFTEAGSLYMYEPAGAGAPAQLTDLTPVTGADVLAMIGASEDGSYVYFVAEGALAEGARAGMNNIYLWHEGVTSFVAAVGNADYALGPVRAETGGSVIAEEVSTPGYRTLRVSPDGRYLAFESSESLTGYDNMPIQAGECRTVGPYTRESIYANVAAACSEVYEYDAGSGRLACVSCSPRGLPPVGNSFVPMAQHELGRNAGWQTPTVQQRYLLDDGRVFFDSADELLPQASNGRVNVYEFEPDRVGSCQAEAGCLGLISSGTSSGDSYFVDAGASGKDVFFTTREQLVSQDGDEAIDLYDAREGGGFSVAVPAPCGGEACRPPATPALAIYQAPPSATFAGAGNPSQLPQKSSAPIDKNKKKKKPKKRQKVNKAKRRKRVTARGRGVAAKPRSMTRRNGGSGR